MTRLLPALLAAIASATTAALAQQPGPLPSPAPSHLAIAFEEVTERTVDGEVDESAPASRETRQTKWVATFGPRRLAVQSDDTLKTWDFAAGVVRNVDRSAGTYTQVSMLHEVAFVQNELRNRLGLKRMLQSAAIPIAGEWTPFDLAVLFCWPVEGDDVALTHVEKDGVVESQRDGRVVASWRLSEHRLDAAQIALYARFLQRWAHLHPQSLAALSATGRVPQELEFQWRDVGVRATAKWRLTEVRTDAEWPGELEGLTRSFGTGQFARIAAMVDQPDAEGVPERLTVARFAELAEAARAAGRHGDAVMLLLEASLATGESMPQLAELGADPAAKEDLQRFLRPVTLADRDPDTALELFDQIDRSLLSHPAILGAFRATALMGRREVIAARDQMLETLEALPWLTMGYKDLGDFHMVQYETAAAWTAWELGRRIAPKHACWQPVEAYERQLRRVFAARL